MQICFGVGRSIEECRQLAGSYEIWLLPDRNCIKQAGHGLKWGRVP